MLAVIPDLAAAQRQFLGEILFAALAGMGIYPLTRIAPLGYRWNTVQAARYHQEKLERRLPLLPGIVLYGLFFTMWPIVRNKCPEFGCGQTLLIVGLAVCAGSTVSWLMAAFRHEQETDYRKREEIEEFLSDPRAPVPVRAKIREGYPLWLRAWNLANVTVFLPLMARIAFALFVL
jgi:hypothetical protein